METNKTTNTTNTSKDTFDLTEYLHDTKEQIQLCLNCKKPECTNCLYWLD